MIKGLISYPAHPPVMARKRCQKCGCPLMGEVCRHLDLHYPDVFNQVRDLCPVCDKEKVSRLVTHKNFYAVPVSS